MLNRKAILLVEDCPDDVELTMRALKKNDIKNEVVVANDGVEALDFLFGRGKYSGRDTGELPALMVLDLKIPKIGGLEVLRNVRADERTRNLPVVILTSSKEDRDLLSGYALGANSYVRKPVDFNQFADTAGLLGLYWLRVNEAPPAKGGAE